MQTVILDDHGRTWDARSPALRSFLHCSLPDFDFLTYLVENLGFVAVTKIAPNAARIRFRPETVSQTSIAAALYHLADMGIERTIISHPDQFVEKLVPGFAQTIAYITEQIAASHQQSSSVFTSREQPLETLANTDEALSSLFAQWIDSKRVYDSATLADVLPESLRGRFMLVEPVDGRLTITDVGSGFEIFGETWRKNARGLPMEEQPDYNYGQWVQGIYRRVQETLVPRLDEVNATIRRPDRNDSIHCHYQRLILPFTCKGSGRICLLGASVVDFWEQQSALDRRAVEECPA
ncbi:hypothetical protein J6524_16510 [Bradyrhizobium sp. WSM 1738]|uniref:hypothetical protein n=1 Tax=Bradyrhizobium hereditatis TaxID=2821405 RepID=UPI001CE2D3FD|nr:hypothetical protein [Bradyrhizobium hereditatis]MCA6116489.1 hypothetical protein [Bradyrhizobium hereditatis]